jgi:hypothetical protein
MDRKFGENGFAFVLCSQELGPGEYTHTSVIHTGAKFRCELNAIDKDGKGWTSPLADGETAALIGLLSDDSVVGLVHTKGSNEGRLVIWRKEGSLQRLPWLPPQLDGNIDSASRDFSRYGSFATNGAPPCNPLGRILGSSCDDVGDVRWFIFDRKMPSPIVNRRFLGSGRASISPDGLHYASFEANELRIYPLPAYK